MAKGALERPPAPRPWYEREVTFGPVWPLKQRRRLFAELAITLEAGLDLRESLTLVRASLSRGAARSVDAIERGYVAGEPLAQLFAAEGFSAFEVQALAVGERANELPRVCHTVAHFHDRMLELRGKIVAALSYPLFVLGLSAGVLYFLLRYLVPMFAETFAQGGMTLPPITLAVQGVAEWLGTYGPLALPGVAGLSGCGYLYRERPALKRALGWVQLHVPIVKSVAYNLALAKTCRSLHLLLENGVGIVRALKLSADVGGILQLEEHFVGVAEGIVDGGTLHAQLARSPLLPARFAALIRIAEATHGLPAAFARLAEGHERAADESSERLKTFVEPVMIIGLGIIVGIILISMYLPLFSMTTAVRG